MTSGSSCLFLCRPFPDRLDRARVSLGQINTVRANVSKTDTGTVKYRLRARKSLYQGQVPEEWRQANVTPIYKKGSKSSPGNYRPVSLTSVCCKLMESIIKDDIMEHLGRNKLIRKSQHGFMPGRSCTTNLLEFLEKITEAADRGVPTDVVYLDFAKAFDKVPTERLMKKVAAHGIIGKVGAWIRAWLKNRRQLVSVNGTLSGQVRLARSAVRSPSGQSPRPCPLPAVY